MDKVYKLGQVLFIILNEKKCIYPVQVIEIIEKKSLHNDAGIQYIVQTNSSGESRASLSALEDNGEVFESLIAARNVLLERTTATIDKMLQMALSKAKEWYNCDVSSDDFDEKSKEKKQSKQRKNINKPEQVKFEQMENQQFEDNQTLSIDNLKNQIIELPDGTTAKIRSVTGL